MTSQQLDITRTVLIETYWNVNFRKSDASAISKAVLIETYWNVNAGAPSPFLVSFFVLIETYWNVNEELKFLKSVMTRGINRNILECKLRIHGSPRSPVLRINRNILECK